VKIIGTALVVWLLVCVATAGENPLAPVPALPMPPGIEVLFGPQQKLEDRIVRAIDEARIEILVSQYVLTAPRILQALVSARARGRFVAVILEPRPALRKYETPEYLRRARIPVLLRGGERGLNNQKIFVLDRVTVITGSYDPTQASMDNDDNLMVVREPATVASYFNAWVEQAARSAPVP